VLVRRQPQGRRSLGFQLEVPPEVGEVEEGQVLKCRELRQGGSAAGELEISVFAAALIIDRDGLLAERACDVLSSETAVRGRPATVAVSLPGASGFRASTVRRADLPYLHVLALAPADLGIDGGVVVTLRTATPDWAAAEHMLRSLRLLAYNGTPNGRVTAGTDTDDAPILPVVSPTRD